jgi:predicted DCC family thiol-disulfide oxidoreductase YuxK
MPIRGTQHGAVAADHDHESGLPADLVDLHRLHAGHLHMAGGLLLEHDAVAAVTQEVDDGLHRLVDPGRVVPHDQRDGLLRFGRSGHRESRR